jgi:NADPH:quinone reductase-like Zn-dependent oxidoreductase
MRAAFFETTGGPDVIRYGEIPDAVAGPGEVLVRPEAVGVDAVDAIVRSGRWATPLHAPAVLGRDLVGTVVALGEGAAGFAVGDAVWTNSAGYGGRAGATAELVPVERDRLYTLPEGADPVAFVAAVHAGATAYGVLLGRAALRPGETLAVIGGTGAIGQALIQVGAAVGARVVATVRDDRAGARLRELGADAVVVAGAPDAVGAAAAEHPLDVLVDTTGRIDTAAALAHLAPRGRVVLVAGRSRADLDLWDVETRELVIAGFIMSAMTAPELAVAAAWINGTHPARPLTSDIGEVLSFADARRAHELLDAGELPRTRYGTVGRIVLTP